MTSLSLAIYDYQTDIRSIQLFVLTCFLFNVVYAGDSSAFFRRLLISHFYYIFVQTVFRYKKMPAPILRGTLLLCA